MNRDDVIKMARETKGEEIFVDMEEGVALFYMDINDLERFAQLVAAQAAAEEREACAEVADDYGHVTHVAQSIAAAIRARGTA